MYTIHLFQNCHNINIKTYFTILIISKVLKLSIYHLINMFLMFIY